MLCQYLGRRIAQERSQVLRIHQENNVPWKNHLGPGQVLTCVCWGTKLKCTWSWTISQRVLPAPFRFCKYFSRDILQLQILSWCGDHSTNTDISPWALVISAHPKALPRFTLSKSLTLNCQQRETWLGCPWRRKKRCLKNCFQQHLSTGGLNLVRCGLVHSAWCQPLFSLTLHLWVRKHVMTLSLLRTRQEDSLIQGVTLRGSSVWRVNTSCPRNRSAFAISCTSSCVKTSSFSSRRGTKCFLVYMTHSTVTTPRFLPASANSEKGNCKAIVKYTSYFCSLWALWGFDCILYY